MRLGQDTGPDEVAKAMALITDLIGEANLEKRWAELENQRRSVVRGAHVAQTYALELAHRDAVEEGAFELGWPTPRGNPPLLRLYAFATSFLRLHAVLSEPAQTRLKGSLRGKYLGDVGLGPLAYELEIATHLSRMGFEVEFHDLENDGGFDFLAITDNGIEIEIECKHISADLGRKIHRHESHLLFDLLLPMLIENADALRDGQVLNVEVRDRLESSREGMDEIVSLAATAIHAPSGRAANDVGIVSLEEEDVNRPETVWNSGQHHGGRFRNIGVILRSAKDDGVIDQIKRNLKKDAKRQFSKGRPSALFAHVSDLTGAQLAAIERAQKDGVHAVQRMASEILVSREHLSAVSLTTKGEPVAETGPGNPIGDRGVMYGFSKLPTDHPAYTAVRRAILGPDADKRPRTS